MMLIVVFVVFVDVMIPMFDVLFVRVMAFALCVRVMAFVFFVRLMLFVSVVIFLLFVSVVILLLFVLVMIFVFVVSPMILRLAIAVHRLYRFETNKECVIYGGAGCSQYAAYAERQLVMVGKTGIRHTVTEHERVT